MRFWKFVLIVIPLVLSTSINAALLERLGGLAYYDTEANLTWLADANFAMTCGYTIPGYRGRMNWAEANTWTANLNIAGITGWRLPDTVQPDTSCDLQIVDPKYVYSWGANCTGSELGNLYYNVLGGVASQPISIIHNANYDLFRNIQLVYEQLWSATEDVYFPDFAWYFDINDWSIENQIKNYGNQYGSSKLNFGGAWPVQSGDVGNGNAVIINNIEITQAIKNTKTNELVAGKDSIIRIFASVDPGSPAITGYARYCWAYDEPANVCRDNWLWLSSTGTIYPSDYVFTDAEYLAAADSINIPVRGYDADKVGTGSHAFKIELYKDNQSCTSFLGEQIKAFTFVQSTSIGILTVPIQYSDPDSSISYPDDTMLDGIHKFVQVAFPVDENKVTNTVYKRNNLTQFSGDLTDVTARCSLAVQLNTIHINKTLWSSGADLKYTAGVLNSMTGTSQTLGNNIVGYTCTDTKDIVVTVDINPINGNSLTASTMAHEIGHTLNLDDEYCKTGLYCAADLNYPNKPPQNVNDGDEDGRYVKRSMNAYDSGLFFSNKTAVFNTSITPMFGFMGAGDDTNTWIGNVEYEYLFSQLTSAAPITPPVVVAVSNSQASREVINISGMIDKSDNVALERFLIVDSTAEVAINQGSQYSIEFGDGGNMIGVVNFDLKFKMEVFTNNYTGGVKDIDTTPFSITADLPTGTNEVTLLHGVTPLITVVRSANTPVVDSVSIFYPNTFNAVVNWTGSDADNDALTYTVIYSPDGVKQELIASSVPNTTANIYISTSPEQLSAYIVVAVSDGFNTSEKKIFLNDEDGDGINDASDNCTLIPNPDQRDTDTDGYGNMCDGDLNNDGRTNTLDLNLYKQSHRTRVGDANYNPDADFNGDGRINTLDLNIYNSLHRKLPGPSGLVP